MASHQGEALLTDSEAVEVRQYDPAVYNSLQDFPEVAQSFRSRNGKFFIRSIRKVYLRHKVEGSLGVGLVHRHFDLSADERLVQEGNKSTPRDIEDVNKTNVIPSAWAFRNGALYPYEFKVTLQGANGPELPPAFISELYALLKSNKYEDVLGVITFSGEPTCEERTEGRANILTLVQGDPASSHTVPASWGFFGTADSDNEGIQIVAKCECKCDWYYDEWGMTAGTIRAKTWVTPKVGA
jgi:hypothetical protein